MLDVLFQEVVIISKLAQIEHYGDMHAAAAGAVAHGHTVARGRLSAMQSFFSTHGSAEIAIIFFF